MTFEFYTDLTNFAIGIGFWKSPKYSAYFYNISIEFMLFMVVFRFGKINELTEQEWTRE